MAGEKTQENGKKKRGRPSTKKAEKEQANTIPIASPSTISQTQMNGMPMGMGMMMPMMPMMPMMMQMPPNSSSNQTTDPPKRKRGRPSKKDKVAQVNAEIQKSATRMPVWANMMQMPYMPPGLNAEVNPMSPTSTIPVLPEKETKRSRGTGKPRGRPRTRPRPGDEITRPKPANIAPAQVVPNMIYGYMPQFSPAGPGQTPPVVPGGAFPQNKNELTV